MLTDNDIRLLCDAQVQLSIEQRLDADPAAVALDKRLPHAALVASQVKGLQRCREKLPSYYAARCIVPGRAYEQASSEATAAARELAGDLAVDLTCGLGVDTLALSKRFGRVIAVERDAVLAEVARINFARLGAENIEVVCASAEEFLDGMGDLHADVIFADPDRRSASGRKMVVLADCSPDVAGLLPVLRRCAARVVVKLSPMFDVDEALRIFGPRARVEAVSLGGECKEVVVATGESVDGGLVATAIGVGSFAACENYAPAPRPEAMKYLVVADVALRKARLVREYFASQGIWCPAADGFGWTATAPGPVMGKVFEVEGVEEFRPGELRRELKAQGVRRVSVMVRDFPLSAPEVARALGVAEGGERLMAFTQIDGKRVAIIIKKILPL